jgi:uncharacterized protein YxjI
MADRRDIPSEGRAAEQRIGPRFQMPHHLFAETEDLGVFDEHTRLVFRLGGARYPARDALEFKDVHGKELCVLESLPAGEGAGMRVVRDGATVATVRDAATTPIHDRFPIELATGALLSTSGRVMEHDYRIERGGEPIAIISGQWVTAPDSAYGVEVAEREDPLLVLAIAACIDQMAGAHP